MRTYLPMKRQTLLTLVLAACFFMAGLFGAREAAAQPTTYCIPFPNANYQYNYCYSNYYGYIAGVRVFNTNSGVDALSRTSGDDACYIFTGVEGNVKLGNSYTIRVTGFNPYMYGGSLYTRCFIDWNQDGDFLDQGEYLGAVYTSYPYYSTGTFDVDFKTTVNCATKLGKTRMRVMTSQWYNQGADPCTNGYVYAPYYNYGYGETEDYVLNFIPDVEATFPDQDNILYANESYDGTQRLKNGATTTFTKPFLRMGSVQPTGTVLRYKIVGPLPSTQVVYEALDPVTGSTDIAMGGYRQYDIQRARGIYALSDGSFKTDHGGEYRLTVSVSGAGCPGDANKTFTVSWNNDLSARDIVSPKSNIAPRFFKYLRGNTIKVTGTFQNTGLTNVTKFNANAIIIGLNGRDTIYNRTVTYDTAGGNALIPPTGKTDIDFPTFRNNEVGVYRMYLNCDLLSALDQEDYNDHLPRQADQPYTFEIQHEIQLQASQIMLPYQGQKVLGNRPLIPMGEFKNVGVGDASDVPAKLTIYKLQPTKTVVYQSPITVQDVPSGKYNTKTEFFDPLVLTQTGDYQACLVISHPDDGVRDDDTTCITFSVTGGLEGTYTVGTQKAGDARNYLTIDSAMNDLYMRGLAGPVTFELTDAAYTVTSKRFDFPAWDFSSYIINSGYNSTTKTYNTITWKPSATRALSKAGVTIDLQSGNGQGIIFGENIDPTNDYSVFKEYWNKATLARKYAKSMGYITFDGGSQKALKFVLHSNSGVHASAFYLGKGTENVTIKNVIVENGTPSLSQNVWMPMTQFSPMDGFSFQGDTVRAGASQIFSYSAGIVNRSVLLKSEKAQALNLDTLTNHNNTIEGNDISGFGYGILSLGIGELLIERTGDYQRYYNHDNTITGNTIHDVYRAGVYLGYEENSNITNNRIYNVGGTDLAAAGIMAGGDGLKDYKGYNNIALNISGNEISGVTSGIYAAGIKVEQQRNTFPHSRLGQVFYPDVNESMNITNNVVWGITTSDAAATKAGIHIFTERNGSFSTPRYADYNTRNDKVLNNTVIVSSDAGLVNTGFVAGIALQQATGAQLYNNAVAVLDNEADASSPVFAAIFYEGVMPKNGGLAADRNAFWVPGTSPAAVYRFVETDANNNIIDPGTRDDYKTLSQWQIWTGADRNSIFGDFTGDLTFTGVDPNRKLRINGTPTGSILNNRGDRIASVATDIDNNTRGDAGQRYDIGAFEFAGTMRVNDIEATSISSPSAYMSGTGTFSDAEYVMTTAPVEVKALFRNNGSIQASGVKATVKIYREKADGTFPTTTVLDQNIKIDLASTETIEAAFNLGDGQAPDFRPQAYSELSSQGYTVPSYFKTMKANVTPRYKIEVSVESDQYNNNNIATKIVRFYISRSGLNMLVSAENSMTTLDANSTADQIAGRLNYDTLTAGFRKIGWIANTDSSRYDFDVFDRLGWEPKTVNYTMYRTLVWSDGNDKSLSRFERSDIRNYLTSGTSIVKKNLVVGSQEMVRSNEAVDQSFVRGVLSAKDIAPSNPLGAGVSNDGNTLTGLAIGRGLAQKIVATKYAGDAAPYSGLVGVYNNGDGLALSAYYYKNHSISKKDSVAGVAASTLTSNVVYTATDWRHFGDIATALRESFDYVEKNGGIVIPVELTDFRATARDKRIEVVWSTATELNSDRFEVERAERVNGTTSAFEAIATEKAAGKSVAPRNYGPVVDRNVEMNRTYVYRLRMFDKDGSSKLSGEAVASLTGSDVLWMAEATPNPAETMANVSYSVPQSGVIEIALYDMAGRKVMTVASGSVEAGTHEIKLNVSSLTNGVYNLMLTSGNETVSRQIRVIK